MRPSELKKVFTDLCRESAGRSEALYAEFLDEKNACVFSMYFRMIKVQLVYAWRWTELAPPSVLYCRIFLSKNNPLYLHLPELLGYLKPNDFRACYFPCIETNERMHVCFHTLMSILDDYIPVIEQLCSAGQDADIMDNWLNSHFYGKKHSNDALPINPDDKNVLFGVQFTQQAMEGILISRFTVTDAYVAFLKGHYQEALEKYKKLEKHGLYAYEAQLCDYLQTHFPEDLQPMPQACFSLPEYQKIAGQKADYKGILLLYPPFAAFFCGLLAIIRAFLSHSTVHYSGIHWWFGLILALLPPIFCYSVFQNKLILLANKDAGPSAVHFLNIAKPRKWLKTFSAIALAVCMAAELWFCFGVSNMSMRFYDTYGIYYSQEEKLERFDYEELSCIYYMRARYNEYGDRIERASYVLLLSDGTYIDLDGSTNGIHEQKQLIEKLFSHLEIIEIDSDADLNKNP